ncbi:MULTISPECIES: hypothetical protein [Micromonospora]|uniref:hypothetical protein n=1 Tax=Micromonospora TaxID=1873 RepID=UPI000B316104|nr:MULTISPECIES: hypothetical protein [Micromonospora]MCK1806839.1 hypothetical protein [Micromonospora sp. R42106]MCK1833669.1 hypothetical protein [Micromonospora sp. R42003]MCK1846104.1 hypothetical protein [Micromonospora sp. R42004]MCM1018783.1 hypothetical protein [Micromonospora sp. XM-20-01]
MRPQPGDLLRVDGRASVQFGGDRALTFRVVSVGPDVPHTGWIWLTGYVLNRRGTATVKREIFVQATGLRRHVDIPTPGRARAARPYAARNDQGDGGAARHGEGLRARADAR